MTKGMTGIFYTPETSNVKLIIRGIDSNGILKTIEEFEIEVPEYVFNLIIHMNEEKDKQI